jgi:hypothetical protein
MYSFYAAVKGARRVVCMEPEADGSSSGIIDNFKLFSDTLGLNNVTFVSKKLLDFNWTEKFDIIILINSINHLDEEMCVILNSNFEARLAYKLNFDKIYQLSNDKAIIVACDCSNRNFFGDIGVKNPFNPTIEWKKHQKPSFWVTLFGQTGFEKLNITWTTFNRTGKVGKILLGNKYLSYFFQSHFCLTLKKVNE